MKSLYEVLIKHNLKPPKKLKNFITPENYKWVQYILCIRGNNDKTFCVNHIDKMDEKVFYREFLEVLFNYPFEDYIDDPEPLDQDGVYIYDLINSLPDDLFDSVTQEFKEFSKRYN